jgi:hypothetical protein
MWINIEGISQLVDAVSFLLVVPELLGESQLTMLRDLIVGAAKSLGMRLYLLGTRLPLNTEKLFNAVWTKRVEPTLFDIFDDYRESSIVTFF